MPRKKVEILGNKKEKGDKEGRDLPSPPPPNLLPFQITVQSTLRIRELPWDEILLKDKVTQILQHYTFLLCLRPISVAVSFTFPNGLF